MKRRNYFRNTVALALLVVAGTVAADTLLSRTYNTDGSYTEVWVDSSGSVYTRSCNVAGSCISRDFRKER